MFLEEVQVRSSNPPKTNTSFFILDLQLIGEGPAKAAFFFKHIVLIEQLLYLVKRCLQMGKTTYIRLRLKENGLHINVLM